MDRIKELEQFKIDILDMDIKELNIIKEDVKIDLHNTTVIMVNKDINDVKSMKQIAGRYIFLKMKTEEINKVIKQKKEERIKNIFDLRGNINRVRDRIKI